MNRTAYSVICTAFCMIAVISNIISAKMVRVPLFENVVIPAGLITFSFTFMLSDLVTELYGTKAARLMVNIAVAMNLLSFALIQFAVVLPGVNPSEQDAFSAILGLSGWRIFSSLVAFVTAQLVTIQLYAVVKKWSGPMWLSNYGSTAAGQIVDTVMVDMLYFYWGLGMAFQYIWPIMLISYTYKLLCGALITPLFYLAVSFFKKEPSYESRM